MPAPTALLEPATDWIRQATHERLKECAGQLYLHDYIDAAQLERILDRIRDDLARAGTTGKVARHG